jgi:type I restriction enzyme M protein
MNMKVHNDITNFIWNIADDVLRDVYVCGKYRDVILPMTVVRRLDCLLEPTKDAVLAMKKQLDKAGIANQEVPLSKSAGQAFYKAMGSLFEELIRRFNEENIEEASEHFTPRDAVRLMANLCFGIPICLISLD